MPHPLSHTNTQSINPAGEYISVASQKDAEEADIEKERAEQRKGPEAQQRELEELANIYVQVSSGSGSTAITSSSSQRPHVCICVYTWVRRRSAHQITQQHCKQLSIDPA